MVFGYNSKWSHPPPSSYRTDTTDTSFRSYRSASARVHPAVLASQVRSQTVGERSRRQRQQHFIRPTYLIEIDAPPLHRTPDGLDPAVSGHGRSWGHHDAY